MESAVHLTSKKRGMVTLTDLAPPAQRPVSPAAYAVGLTKTYGTGEATVHALAGVDVTFERGRFTAVMGPSGSGKSTLMHCMAGLDRPTSGQSFVGDLDIGALDDGGLTQMRRDHIGFVFQSFNLVPTLTAAENITLPVDLAGRKVDKEWFDYLVDQLGIADRPTGNLDSNSTTEMLTFLRRSVTEFGQSIVMVTHDPHGASYADRVVFLADGNIVDDLSGPTPDSVLERIRTLGT